MLRSNDVNTLDAQLAIKLAIRFNNTGVNFLRTKTLDDAWGMFKGALETVKLEYRQEFAFINAECSSVTQNHHVKSAMAQLDLERKRWGIDPTKPPPMMVHESSAISCSVGESINCFIPHPFEVHGLDFSKPDTSITSTAVVSAVVLYNLALVDHMRWLEGTQGDKSAIDTIVKLYSLSYGLTQQEELEEHLVHLHLALLNNMGQLFYEMGEYAVARVYLDGLSHRMSFLSSRGRLLRNYDKSKAVIIGSEPFEGFLSNILLLHPPTAASSA